MIGATPGAGRPAPRDEGPEETEEVSPGAICGALKENGPGRIRGPSKQSKQLSFLQVPSSPKFSPLQAFGCTNGPPRCLSPHHIDRMFNRFQCGVITNFGGWLLSS